MIVLEEKKDCCGCGSCEQICPKHCITMERDEEGFLYPRVDEDACIGCGACRRACPVLAAGAGSAAGDVFPEPAAVGGWLKDDDIRYDSSSGGAFTLFARYVLERGGIVYGACLDEDLQIRHVGVRSMEELHRLRGSKYVQSAVGDVYRQIKDHLRAGRYVLFTGTPCQAAGLYTFLGGKRHERLYIVDFICHGVPSPGVFEDYIGYLEEKHGAKVTGFRFRMKDKNWHPSGLQLGTEIVFDNGETVRNYPAFRDPFMNAFLDDVCLRQSCYTCAFKKIPKEYADITIADFWGVDKAAPSLNDGKGTSLILFNTAHGRQLFEEVKDDYHYETVDFRKAIRKNPTLIRAAKENSRRAKFFRDYKKKPFSFMVKKYMGPITWGFHKAAGIAWKLIEKIIRSVLTPVLSLMHIHWEEKQWEDFFQFVRFIMVGLTNAAVSYTVNVCTLLLLHKTAPGFRYDYVAANTAAFLLSVLWSYYWNSKKVFSTEGEGLRFRIRSLLRTYISYAFTGIVVNNVLSTIWIRGLHISKYIAPLLNIPFTMPINFFMMKKWAYRKK